LYSFIGSVISRFILDFAIEFPMLYQEVIPLRNRMTIAYFGLKVIKLFGTFPHLIK